jgi:Tfp pilus assembly protein PilX
MKKTKKALSLVIAISITLIMGLLALYILEYIIPFSRNTKNIEHSVSAYYMADSAIEDALYSMS